jgi:uncharacterized membrane protein
VTTNYDHDHIVSQYLNRLEAALATAPADERESLVESIATHISEARATLSPHSEAAVRDILDRIGDPVDIAHEVLSQRADQPTPVSRDRAPRRRTLIAILIAGALVVAAFAAFIALRSPTPAPAPATTTTVTATILKEITVPNVIGDPVNQALTVLPSFTFGYDLHVTCSNIPSQTSTVIAQSPAPGQLAKKGSVIRLTVAKYCAS